MNRPKGKLIAIGGNEDKGTYPNPKTKRKYYLDFFELGILKRVFTEMNDPDAHIEVITSASMIPEEVGERYLSAFGILGCTNIGLMHIRDEQDVLKTEYLQRLKRSNGVIFSGGDQSRLTRIFGGTEFLEILTHRYYNEENFVIAGTSAGAMAMSKVMIRGGSVSEALLKGAVKIGDGLNFVQDMVIDSHFIKRGRFGRLIEAVAAYPDKIGIGLGEDTGVLITYGNMIETIGSNLVVIIDGQSVKHNNLSKIEKGRPISIDNLKMHILAKGNIYDIDTRIFYDNSERYHAYLASLKKKQEAEQG